MTDRILVLLPIFNGAPFLAEQLESILNQSFHPLHILCRDDGSTDDSVAILDQYQARYPEQITRVPTDTDRLGVIQSFAKLMQTALSMADKEGRDVYFALADQDDLWQAEKLSVCLNALKKEEQGQLDTPILVHSDLCVISQDGDEIAPSLMKYQGLRPARASFAAQLVSNTVTGCTTLFNVALLRRALPMPSDTMMHDWWIALVASAFGRRIYLPCALVQYRQHSSNTLGARFYAQAKLGPAFIKKVFQGNKDPFVQKQYEGLSRQAQAFYKRFGSDLGPVDRMLLRRVVALAQSRRITQLCLFHSLRAWG